MYDLWIKCAFIHFVPIWVPKKWRGKLHKFVISSITGLTRIGGFIWQHFDFSFLKIHRPDKASSNLFPGPRLRSRTSYLSFVLFIGIFFILPCIDAYARVDLRTRTYDVPPQELSIFASFSNFLMYLLTDILHCHGI